MEEWTSTDLHHAINSTPSDNELADLIEDIKKIMERQRTELQMRWCEIKAEHFNQYEEEVTVLVNSGGTFEASKQLRDDVTKNLIGERFALAAELEALMKEENLRKIRAIEYVAEKEGFECRRLLDDLAESPSENSVLVCDTSYTEQLGLTFVPDQDARTSSDESVGGV